MESFWRMYCHWRPYWRGHIQNKAVVYIPILCYHGLPHRYLHDTRVLDEPETLHLDEPPQPPPLAVITFPLSGLHFVSAACFWSCKNSTL